MRLVDTDILIDIQRGYLSALEWFGSLKNLPSVPGFVVMELMQPAKNKSDIRKVQELIAPLDIVWPRPADLQRALAWFPELRLSHNLGLLDALIAATAVGLKAPLITFNVKHYRAIPGLQTEQPYKKNVDT
jgi:predicted nucleic acid-binding protein